METETRDHVAVAASVVSAYVSRNSVRPADLPGLIRDVHAAIAQIAAPEVEAPAEPLKPAVPTRKSVTDDYIVCLEDGKRFKSLKRHLRTRYNMTPEEYRQKWNLGSDYPMVAPNYARARSSLAKAMGLGQQRRARGE